MVGLCVVRAAGAGRMWCFGPLTVGKKVKTVGMAAELERAAFVGYSRKEKHNESGCAGVWTLRDRAMKIT